MISINSLYPDFWGNHKGNKFFCIQYLFWQLILWILQKYLQKSEFEGIVSMCKKIIDGCGSIYRVQSKSILLTSKTFLIFLSLATTEMAFQLGKTFNAIGRYSKELQSSSFCFSFQKLPHVQLSSFYPVSPRYGADDQRGTGMYFFSFGFSLLSTLLNPVNNYETTSWSLST